MSASNNTTTITTTNNIRSNSTTTANNNSSSSTAATSSNSTSSSYSSGLQGLSRMLGIGNSTQVSIGNNPKNQVVLNRNAAKVQQDKRNNLMANVILSTTVNTRPNTASTVTSSIDRNRNIPIPHNLQQEMNSRSGGSVHSSSSTSNTSVHSSISKSANIEIDILTARILNPEGQNSPANSLRIEDYEINREKEQRLIKKTPRFAGHAGKNPVTVTTYVWVTDGEKCWLMSVNEHLELVTTLVYAMISRNGIVGKKVEGKYWDEVLSRLLAKEDITSNKFHEIISQPLAVIFANSNRNKEYTKKWVQMGGCLLQTIKKKLNTIDGR